jgi:hypothetical protein
MATSKMSRTVGELEPVSGYDFGEPDVIPVELNKGKILYLKEPSAEDLIEINNVSTDSKINEIEATLRTICILHSPEEGMPRLSMKDAKKLTARQLKKLGEAINELLGTGEDLDEEE